MEEKALQVEHHEPPSLDANILRDVPLDEQKRIVRRIDSRLLTTVGALYTVSLIDRTNLSAAAIAGMLQDLRLISNRYSIITLVFFTTYIVFQPPSPIITRKIGPRIHLSLIVFFWGIVMIGMGFVQKWYEMAALRVILGVLEAGFFPSCVYLLSTWYTRYEVGKRYSIFYLLGSVTAAFAGILAYGLMQMKGVADLNGWRWILIMEGIITCILGVAAFWLLVDFPDSKRATWKFLDERERAFIVAKVQADRGDSRLQQFRLGSFLKRARDLKIWGFALIFFCSTTVTYALAFFTPIILNSNLGFSIGESQLLVSPPAAFAGILMFTEGWLGDKVRMRGPFVIFNMLLSVFGLALLGFHPKAGVRYFGIFLVTAGVNSNIPITMAYQANNIRGQWSRAFCSATLVGFGGIGGIAGSLIFRAQDAPGYRPGLSACMGCCGLAIILVVALDLYFFIENRKADRGEKILEASDLEGEDGDEQAIATFRYTY